MRYFNVCILLILILTININCSNTDSNFENTVNTLPDFQIVSEQLNKSLNKAMFDLRIQEKLEENEIIAIANSLKSNHEGFERYFISYLLPNMEPGKGAWATSHFDTNLEVKILGLSKLEEEKLKSTEDPEGEIIGKWLDESPGMSNLTIIYKVRDEYKMRQTFKDGSSSDKKLTKEKNKYVYQNDFGEFVRVEDDGSLSWYDESGKFLNIMKVS